jgi:hypothetical protein
LGVKAKILDYVNLYPCTTGALIGLMVAGVLAAVLGGR